MNKRCHPSTEAQLFRDRTNLKTNPVSTPIASPRGSRIKYKYDDKSGLFELHKVMPAGAVFPFDFGLLRSTRGADGDPLDVLALVEDPLSLGSLVEVRLIGVTEAKQTQESKTNRNDRLTGIAAASHLYKRVRSFRELGSHFLDEIESSFIAYNEMQDRKFKPLGRHNASRAMNLVRAGSAQFEEHSKKRRRES